MEGEKGAPTLCIITYKGVPISNVEYFYCKIFSIYYSYF